MTGPSVTKSEELLFSLRDLFSTRGYSLYKMNKFEEYDLYAKNKDFLASERVITFTDGSGKLLALKPDVTLSIVKNTKDEPGNLTKVFYNENVYRVTKGSTGFREIMQVGLECIGCVDAYGVSEVLTLAKESLDRIGGENLLSVSHLGLLDAALLAVGVPDTAYGEVMPLIAERNAHDLDRVLSDLGVAGGGREAIAALLKIRGPIADAVPAVKKVLAGLVPSELMASAEEVFSAITDVPGIELDFSVTGDTRYYNGFVFKGFVRGVPDAVLSGGQYDKLLRRMGRKSSAIGFAVYLDALERYYDTERGYDADVLLLYDETSGAAQVRAVAEELGAKGSVFACRVAPAGKTFSRTVSMKNGRIVSWNS